MGLDLKAFSGRSFRIGAAAVGLNDSTIQQAGQGGGNRTHSEHTFAHRLGSKLQFQKLSCHKLKLTNKQTNQTTTITCWQRVNYSTEVLNTQQY